MHVRFKCAAMHTLAERFFEYVNSVNLLVTKKGNADGINVQFKLLDKAGTRNPGHL